MLVSSRLYEDVELGQVLPRVLPHHVLDNAAGHDRLGAVCDVLLDLVPLNVFLRAPGQLRPPEV
jgi:hypothetical protein